MMLSFPSRLKNLPMVSHLRNLQPSVSDAESCGHSGHATERAAACVHVQLGSLTRTSGTHVSPESSEHNLRTVRLLTDMETTAASASCFLKERAELLESSKPNTNNERGRDPPDVAREGGGEGLGGRQPRGVSPEGLSLQLHGTSYLGAPDGTFRGCRSSPVPGPGPWSSRSLCFPRILRCSMRELVAPASESQLLPVCSLAA